MLLVHILTLLTIWGGLAIAIWLSCRQQNERKLRRQIRQLRSRLSRYEAA